MKHALQPWDILGTNYHSPEFIGQVFDKFVFLLETRLKIFKIPHLMCPVVGKKLYGRQIGKIIYLRSGLGRKDATTTLIHEITHYIFPNLEEHQIISIHEILWKKFTKEQKEKLTSYIPKRTERSEKIIRAAHRPF